MNEYGILLETFCLRLFEIFFFTHIYLQICVVVSIKILHISLGFLGNFGGCVVNGAFLNYIF